jgi:protein-disulfide isomerase
MKKAWLVTGAALLLSSCGSTKIGRILADPARYQNRGVTVEGTVTNVVGAFVAGVYQVDDGTGKIYVLSTGQGVPNKGVQVKVNGNVTPGLNVMGKSWGTAIRERSHKVRF